MDPLQDRWEHVDAAFDTALSLPASERVAFVEQIGGTDRELADAVSRLLDASGPAGVLIDVSSDELIGRMAGEVLRVHGDALVPGEEIGRYRVLREIGRGGMGTVYLAERADGQFEQRAAVKVLRRGLDTEDVLARFRTERQILASVEHSHIARLLDGGSTAQGQPYLVMEYVEGVPITDYCAAGHLCVEARLRLFVQVARAVQHAHRALVVHRDIKPTNILVTADGAVKLLDFGIAKLLDPSQGLADTPLTRTGARLMTPDYAAPEQVHGGPITTSVDVYQLGVLLYRLLTGGYPYDVDPRDVGGQGRGEWERAICTQEPVRPSVHVRRSGGEARRLRGDLDTIVLKALRKEPQRRYASAEQLAEDVERHLARQPVSARPDTWGYRSRAFARRHTWALATLGLGVVLVLGYLVTLTAHADRIARERDRAQLEAAKAEQVTNFLVSIFEVADPGRTRGEVLTAREILDAGAERARAELGEQPEIRAEMLTVIAAVYLQLGLLSRAGPLAIEALAIREQMPGSDHRGVAKNLLQHARAKTEASAPERAALFERATRAAELAYGPEHPEAAWALHFHGLALGNRADSATRQALYERALAILRSASGDVRAQLAETLMGAAYGSGGSETLAYMREALQLRREVFGEDSRHVATGLSDLALALEQADPPAADSLMRQAVAIHRRVAGEAHPSTLTLVNNLAGLLRDRGENEEAERLYRYVLSVTRRELPGEPARLAYPLYGLARVLLATGRSREAEPPLREVVGIFPEGDERRERARIALAQSLTAQRKYAEAEALLLQGLAVMGQYGPGSGLDQHLLGETVALYMVWGKTRQAARYRSLLAAAAQVAS